MNKPLASPQAPADPQVLAADPAGSVFVSANAGSGKTKTLVDRVARLLLQGARADQVLCVTYTKAAAAEMQRRLFDQLGRWAVMGDAALAASLAAIGEGAGDLSRARTLFAQALEAPGGLKIETLHAFCEKLLRRFPLEAGVSPGFQVMDDVDVAKVAGEARDLLARLSLAGEPHVAPAYAAMAARLEFARFEAMFDTFAARREAIGDYLDRIGGLAGLDAHVARACGLAGPVTPQALERAAVSPPELDVELWREGAAVLGRSGAARDRTYAAAMGAVAVEARAGEAAMADALGVFTTSEGAPARWVETAAALRAAPLLQARLLAEQARLIAAAEAVRAARVAQGSVQALTLAYAYGQAFERAKERRGLLDFSDLVARARALLAEREDALWVLYKLDGGVRHVLVDEAQDTAPEQWDILQALTGDFFAGGEAAGPGRLERTVFLVGDEKQSIYSFQGARPERLAEVAGRLEAQALDAGRRFSRVPLLASWRSTPEVLGFVDAVFAPPVARGALQPRPPGADVAELVRHIAHRRERGAIDLWELERETPVAERRAWDQPLDAEQASGAYRRLAERIAGEIRRLVDAGEAVHDRHGARAAGFGDVLILVRKRKTLFSELLRACKHAGVPVAGADRLVLSEHPAFEDLLALLRVALYPQDDLNLAAVLRSPFCDLDEEGLYALARGADGQGRPGALWTELEGRAGEHAAWAEAHALVAWVSARRGEPPFTLLSHLLTRADGQGRSVRQRFATRLGAEADDALDEILAQALAAERRGVRDLERFVDQLSRLELVVKREMEGARSDDGGPGQVRIMTAHSAKGLEAPIVFLPETVSAGVARGSPLLETPDGGFLWCASKTGDCGASGQVRTLRETRDAQEALRLLYVALTRARDRVVIAGRIDARTDAAKAKGWWGPVRDAFDHPDLAGGVRALDLASGRVRRYGPDPVVGPRRTAEAVHAASPPAWVGRRAPSEPDLGFSAPSGAAPDWAGPAASPLAVAAGGVARLRRGELIHRLLQLLPDLPASDWDAAARRMLEREAGLDDAQRCEMAAAALGVLRDPRFAAVFGPGSRAEAAIAGSSAELPPGYAVSGRVDRLVVGPREVLVADFKTNRPAPDRVEDVDPAYVTQVALYVAVLRSIFPGRIVRGLLIWTNGPKVTALGDAEVARALEALRRRP